MKTTTVMQGLPIHLPCPTHVRELQVHDNGGGGGGGRFLCYYHYIFFVAKKREKGEGAFITKVGWSYSYCLFLLFFSSPTLWGTQRPHQSSNPQGTIWLLNTTSNTSFSVNQTQEKKFTTPWNLLTNFMQKTTTKTNATK